MTDPNEKSNGADIEGPGIQLRRARERRGLLLHDVAQELHLDEWMLQALEEDDFTALGAPVFAKGHMRKYGDMLGIDGDDLIIAYYRKRGRDDSPPPITTMMAPESPRRSVQWRRFGLPLAVLALVIVMLLVFGLLKSGDGPRSPQSLNTAPAVTPSQSAAGSQEQTEEPVLSTQADIPLEPVQDSSSAVAIDLPPPATGVAGDESADIPGGVSAPVAAQPVVDGPAGSPGNAAVGIADSANQAEPANAPETQPVQLRLILTGESWVEVTDSDGDRLIYAILSTGRRRTVSGTPPIEVFLGLSRAVQVEVNGQPFQIPRSAIRGNTARFVIDPDSR